MGQAFRTQYTAVSCAAVTANSYSTGTQTVMNLSSGQNTDGAYEVHLELNVVSAPSTATYAEVWIAESQDNSNFAEYKFACTMQGLLTSAARYSETIQVSAPYAKLIWKPVTYGCSGILTASPSYPA